MDGRLVTIDSRFFFTNKCLNRLLRTRWIDRVSKEEIWRKTGQVDGR